MKKNMIILLVGLIAIASLLVGCDSNATVASRNLSTAADQFQIFRRVVFYNGITDQYIFEVDGYCSLGDGSSTGSELTVTCKVGPNDYVKHFLGLSNNVTYFAEQLRPAEVSTAQYKVLFKPSVILPDIQVVH